MSEGPTATVRRVTANLPRELLSEAQAATKAGITETLIEGLRLLRRRRAFDKAMALKGKIRLDINIDQARERTHR